MQIVIDIPKDVYKETLRTEIWNEYEKRAIRFAIRNCTPLPKGHGRLIDASNLMTVTDYDGENEKTYVPYSEIEEAPTIIEAESEEEE